MSDPSVCPCWGTLSVGRLPGAREPHAGSLLLALLPPAPLPSDRGTQENVTRDSAALRPPQAHACVRHLPPAHCRACGCRAEFASWARLKSVSLGQGHVRALGPPPPRPGPRGWGADTRAGRQDQRPQHTPRGAPEPQALRDRQWLSLWPPGWPPPPTLVSVRESTASRSVTPRLNPTPSAPGSGTSTASMSVSSAGAVQTLSAPVSWRPEGRHRDGTGWDPGALPFPVAYFTPGNATGFRTFSI